MAAFRAAAVRPVAISGDAPAVSQDLDNKAGYTFTILPDPDTTEITTCFTSEEARTGTPLLVQRSFWSTERKWFAGTTLPKMFACMRARMECGLRPANGTSRLSIPMTGLVENYPYLVCLFPKAIRTPPKSMR